MAVYLCLPVETAASIHMATPSVAAPMWLIPKIAPDTIAAFPSLRRAALAAATLPVISPLIKAETLIQSPTASSTNKHSRCNASTM